MSIKFESEEISITGHYCNKLKSYSKKGDRGKGTVVCVA